MTLSFHSTSSFNKCLLHTVEYYHSFEDGGDKVRLWDERIIELWQWNVNESQTINALYIMHDKWKSAHINDMQSEF